MLTTRTFRHDNYEMQCSARAMDRGTFVPELVVCKTTWPTRPRVIAVRREVCLTAEVAIEVAHAQGIAWIADYG